MNKKAIELSVNFLVMLIIALAVFGMGLMLFKQFFSQAENIKQNLDEQTKAELTQKMMSSSEQLIVYPTQMTIPRGSSDVFGVGILNIGTGTDFNISTTYSGCYNNQGDSITCAATSLALYSGDKSVTVGLNKREIFNSPVRVSSGAASAKYAITVEVIDPDGGSLGKSIVYITVP